MDLLVNFDCYYLLFFLFLILLGKWKPLKSVALKNYYMVQNKGRDGRKEGNAGDNINLCMTVQLIVLRFAPDKLL